jgi:hypothetical protein
MNEKGQTPGNRVAVLIAEGSFGTDKAGVVDREVL